MRSTDEQMKDLMERAGRLKERRSAKKNVAFLAGSSLMSLALLIAAASYIPLLSSLSAGGSAEGHYGSLIISGPGLGYAVIGILAFVSGVCVTLLGFAVSNYRRFRD